MGGNMSEKVKVRIQTSCVVKYDQIVEMTRDAWEKLKLTPEKKMECQSFSPISELLDLADVLDWSDYDEPELTVVDDYGKPLLPIDFYCPEN
ncbi:hypothetical protein Ppro_2387 [Pelobacter propionicus DSM 2379]|uniref:Uncharacterized protein n=2 Tax=Pelobacter propionicus TaxID=29543 RepID=A1ARM3_PELPD|nr:hypothetical protein Ppro_2387 [Pelobacter propionicus DSM 2379]